MPLLQILKYILMTMKYLFLTPTMVFLLNLAAFSQDLLMPEWVLTESSPLPNGNAEAWAIGTDHNGHLVWGVNKDMPGLFEFMDALVFKLDEEKNLIWSDTAATGAYAQQSYNLKVTDSLVYLGGRTCSTLGTANCNALFFTTDVNTGATGWDFVWNGGYGYEEIDGIALDADGIIITGWSAGDGTEMDVLLMKIDYAGNIVWQTIWGGTAAKDDHQDGHIVVDDSMVYISGLYDGSPLLGWDGRSILAKFDKTTGEFVDSIQYGRQDIWLNAENALGMASDGTYLYTTGYTTTSANNWDVFVAKFDKELNQIWYSTWGGDSHAESARAITVAPDGSIYIGANTESFGSGGIDIALLKFNPLGDLEWYKTWGGEENDQTLDIHLHDDLLYLTGKAQSFHPTQKWEAILLKIKVDIAIPTIEPTGGIKPNLHFSPNPTNNSTLLTFDKPINRPYNLAVYNVMGQKIKTYSHIYTDEIRIEKEELGSGIFFFHLLDEKQGMAVGKLIVE